MSTLPLTWGRRVYDVLRWRRAQVSVDLVDLARAAAMDFTEGWGKDDWLSARRRFTDRQRELLRELADDLARAWWWPEGGDTPDDIRVYARELRSSIPRAVRALARRRAQEARE
jgi:hypothetical protein